MPIIVHPINQPTPYDIRPYSYSISTGEHISGNLNSVYENDGDTLGIRAWWMWWVLYYEFYIDVYFYFDHVKCDELYFDFTEYNTALEETVVIWVYYTDGTYDGTSSLSQGFHTVTLDNWKFIDRVWISFLDRNYIISGGDRYLHIDLIAAKPVADYSPPTININYQDGDGTDGNSGKWNVNAYDPESGINQETIDVLIDGQFAGDTLGEYNVPNTLGEHTIYVEVENNDGISASRSESIIIMDDDVTPPEIEIQYIGSGFDSNPGYFEWNVYDDQLNYHESSAYDLDSGLFNINISVTYESTEGLDDYKIYLEGTETGSWNLPYNLGIYTIEIFARDNDFDRPDDSLSNILSISSTIIDDDVAPPEIEIQYIGSGFDSNPGCFEWNIYDLDSGLSEINIAVTYESTEGLADYTINLDGTETGSWNLPPFLGIYTIEIFARDNDNDRTLIVDSLTTELTKEQEIIDDDVDPPELANLIITPDIFEINVTFDAIDYSGIGDISIFINGELVEPITQLQDGNTYSYAFENQWLFDMGTSEVLIQVDDDDNDRPNDALSSSVTGTFENVLLQMYEYVIWQLEELKNYIDENLCCCIARCLIIKLNLAICHLYKALNHIENNEITCALIHDCLAKLFVGLAEHKTEIINKKGCIEDIHAEYIIDTLHDIRNNIVLLKGATVGSEQAFSIALIEVRLLNLKDFIEDQIHCYIGKYLRGMISCSAKLLELALIKISKGESIECILNCVQWKLDHILSKINCLLEKGKISEEVANYLIENISEIIESIEVIKTN
ncbi:MAG: hypothetical protein ACFE9N_05835 [Promethearchaeota archaeon]